MNATSSISRVAAFGEWSGSNLGDHAIHEGVLRFFGEQKWYVDSYEFGALSPSPPPVLQPFARTRSAPGSAQRVWPSRMPSVVTRTVRGLRQHARIRQLVPRLAAADVICVGGGALLTDLNLRFPQSLAVLSRAARELRKPLVCLGCSAEGPWSRTAERLIRDFVQQCACIAVRDQRTAERLSQFFTAPIPVFGDFALPTAPPLPDPRRQLRYRLAINVAQGLGVSHAEQLEYERAVVNVARNAVLHLGVRGGTVVYTTGARHDRPAAERVHQELGSLGCELQVGRDVEQLRELMRSSAFVIATRLHAGILALAAGTPVIGFSPTDKITNVFATLGIVSCAFRPGDPMPAVLDRLRELMVEPTQVKADAWSALRNAREQVGSALGALAGADAQVRVMSA